jgi:hypothetical protein
LRDIKTYEKQNTMRKNIFLLLLAFAGLIVQEVSAQQGIRAGWHIAATVNNGNQVGGNLDAFYVGFYRDNKIAPLLAIHTGLEYFQNGWNTDGNNYSKLHTISIPVGLRVKLGPVYAVGGPALNFKVSEDTKILSVDQGNGTNTFDVPVFLGLGVQIAIIRIEARYAWGTIDVNQGNKNQYFQLGLGLNLGKGKRGD